MHPDVDIPPAPAHLPHLTGKLWDGSYWPIGRTMEQRPPTIRAIMPHLAVKILDGRAQTREREQMTSLRVGTQDGRVLLPSPLNLAQWMGVPQEFATTWLSATVGCCRVVDDIDGDDMDYWNSRPPEARPPPDRVAPCRQRRWCKQCGDIVSLLGNGWHVGGTSALLAAVLRAAAFAKLGKGAHIAHPFHKYPVHHCSDRCSKAVTLDSLKLKQRKLREPPLPPPIFV